jgi:hypothetical protein
VAMWASSVTLRVSNCMVSPIYECFRPLALMEYARAASKTIAFLS